MFSAFLLRYSAILNVRYVYIFSCGHTLGVFYSILPYTAKNGYRNKWDRWPKTQNVTMSHSILGQLYGPKRDIVTISHSLWGQLYGPNRDQKLFKNSNKVTKLFQNSKNRKRDSVTFLIGSTFAQNIRCKTRDNVKPYKNKAFFSVGVTWQGHRFNLIR